MLADVKERSLFLRLTGLKLPELGDRQPSIVGDRWFLSPLTARFRHLLAQSHVGICRMAPSLPQTLMATASWLRIKKSTTLSNPTAVGLRIHQTTSLPKIREIA